MVSRAAVLFVVCCLSGCSISFCGTTFGKPKEMVFSCDEETVSPQAEEADEAGKTDGGTEEAALREAARQSAEDAPESVPAQTEEDDGKVDLNLAGVEELTTLNGIGETRAKAIIAYREEHGAFSSIEDIMQVPGIKEGVFSKIQDQIIVH